MTGSRGGNRAPSEPAVDVGLPAFRRPQMIGEAIESVLAQTHGNWRLTISENGPGGGDVEAAVRRYTADPRIDYVCTGRNLGHAPNWTRLLRTGNAPYVTLIQDDDLWEPGFLARRVAFLERHPSCGFVFSGERMLDGDGAEIAVERTRSLPERDVSEVLAEGVYEPEELFSLMYRHRLGGVHAPTVSSGGVMSRRATLRAVGDYLDDSRPFLFPDVELYTRMALHRPTGFLAVRDVRQRIHHPSISAESSHDGERWIRYHEYYGDWLPRELPGFRMPREFDQLLSEAYITGALDALEQSDRPKAAAYLRGALRSRPASLLNPRVAMAAVGLLLGRPGANALGRIRGARRRRSDTLAYEADEPGRA